MRRWKLWLGEHRMGRQAVYVALICEIPYIRNRQTVRLAESGYHSAPEICREPEGRLGAKPSVFAGSAALPVPG